MLKKKSYNFENEIKLETCKTLKNKNRITVLN